MSKLWLPLLFALSLRVGAVAPDAPLYKDATAPIPDRVSDLLGRMTTEEKVAQLLELWGGSGVFEKLLKVYNSTGVGAA